LIHSSCFVKSEDILVIYEQHTKREHSRTPSLSTMIEWREQAQSFEQIEGIVCTVRDCAIGSAVFAH
jgi:hypothetical protein